MSLNPLALENFDAAIERVDRLAIRDERARAEMLGLLLLENARHARATRQEIRGDIEVPPEKVRVTVQPATVDGPVARALRAWRKRVAGDRPPYTVIHDRTLLAVAEVLPRTLSELERIRGLGPYKVQTYGADILRVVADTAGPQVSEPSAADDPEAVSETVRESYEAQRKILLNALRKRRLTMEQILELDGIEDGTVLIRLEAAGRIRTDKNSRYYVVKPKG